MKGNSEENLRDSSKRVELVLNLEGWSRRVRLGTGPLLIGRSPDCDVQLADGRLSRHHCRLYLAPNGSWLIEDLGSQSGTMVAGVPITAPTPLRWGECLKIGPLDGRFELLSSEAFVLSGELERDASNISALLKTIDDLQRTMALSELLRLIVDRTIALAGADRGALFLAREGQVLEVAVARDKHSHDLPPDQALVRSLPIRALESGRAILLTDATAPEQKQNLSKSVVQGGLASVLCVPLPDSLGPMGVLYVDGQRAAELFGPAELAIFEALAVHGALAIERERLREDQARRDSEARARLVAENTALKAKFGVLAPIGQSASLGRVLEMIRRIAPSDVTICLTGETGCGKEVLARYLHWLSPRASDPFIVVDCGAIPEGLIESELFGHEKGSFTGAAAARPGCFRAAEGGTLFLDEIGELPLPLQTRLLRVLQERTVRPVGATTDVPINVRVICATHRDLAQRVAQGQFRQDLYYRVMVLPVPIPPLRERPEDIPLLARHFLSRFSGTYAPTTTGFTREATAALSAYHWPGNVRELEHVVQRSVLLANPPYVTCKDLGLGGDSTQEPAEPTERELPIPRLPKARAAATARFERAYLEDILQRTGGNTTSAAAVAGVSKQLLRRLIQRYGIDRGDFSQDESADSQRQK